ncbi:hypothetical protein [Pseudomonas sp. ESBL9]|uniref:hypothetical protein n=1 Tax=Pseudomonas sp. ESBL9 TaxID=3077327 RepID=UPI002FCAB67E
MEIKSILTDHKVSARSILIEIKVADYLNLAKEILKSNQFQRKRVRGSKSVYSLLKKDILSGCVMPPIVLAYTREKGNLEDNLENSIKTESGHFSLLDGLQRTYTLIDIEQETADTPNIQEGFLNGKIRCEIYEGINRLGILYRMLTLNTGQTAMSLRHQIEIMYLNFLDIDIQGVRLVREVDDSRARQANEYNFRDAIEGFNSYIERSESPLDRGDILDNISSLENLAKENNDKDLFKEFVSSWDDFMRKIQSLNIQYPSDDTDSTDPDHSENSTKKLWAANGVQAFKRAQAISGYGAAIGLLRDDDEKLHFDTLSVADIIIGSEPEDFITQLNDSIDNINSRAKKIGNAQRLFFRQFFKMLFWKESGCYLNLFKSQEEAYKSSIKIGI